MKKRFSAVAASCFVFMCGNAARANMLPFDPADLNKDPSRAKPHDSGTEGDSTPKEKDEDKDHKEEGNKQKNNDK